MSISSWSNRISDIPPYLRDEEVPYALPLVLRVEKSGDLPSHEEALLATAAVVAKLFSSDDAVENPLWSEPLEAWMRGRIRKVARRARASAWDKVKDDPSAIYASYGNAEVCVLPPHPMDIVPESIRKLQVAGLDLPSAALSSSDEGLLLALNPEVKMTTGKSMAQIGHAVQLSIFNSDASVLEAWEHKGFPVGFTSWDSNVVWTAEVQDAGFTEVEAGSFTVRGILR